MLSNKKKKKMVEGISYCAECNVQMKEAILPTYEYEEGIPLKNVLCLRCPKCENIFFTEEQAEIMERRTEEIKKIMFEFIRTISKSGRSLVLRIPQDVRRYYDLEEGEKVKIIPVGQEGFMVKCNIE